MNKTIFTLLIQYYRELFVTVLCLAIPVSAVMAAGQGDVNRGAKAWANTCSRCHNIRHASEFRDDLWQPIVNHMRIRAGIPGWMARDILAYLQSSNYTAATAVTAVTGKGMSGQEVYSGICVACHGADGKGALPGVPNLKDRLARSADDILLQRIMNGYQTPGSVMAMPPRGGNPNLTDGEIKKVLSYIRDKFGG